MKVVITTAIEYEPDAIDHKGVKQGLDWMGWDYLIADPIMRGPEDAIRRIKEFQPDLIIHYMDIMLKARAPEEFHSSLPDTKQVFWQMDYRPIAHNIENSYDQQWDNWKIQAQYLDHIFLSNKGQIDVWKEAMRVPTSYLPHGCYVFEKPIKDEKHYYPCVFIGSMMDASPFKDRKILIEKINKLIPVHILNDTNEGGRNDIWRNMPKIYHTSDTVLDISHFWDNPGYVSGRYFYSAGLGGCSITKRFPDCEKLYPEGTKTYFDTPKEAARLIKYYQKHKKEREEMKLKAFEHTKKHHNFKKRFQHIYDIFKKS